jgi:hypothetical protein
MNKEELKISLVEIFTTHKPKKTIVSDKFISEYKKLFWKKFLINCKSNIISGLPGFVIDDYFVSSYDLKIGSHERREVYGALIPKITEWLDNANVPYKITTSNKYISLRF